MSELPVNSPAELHIGAIEAYRDLADRMCYYAHDLAARVRFRPGATYESRRGAAELVQEIRDYAGRVEYLRLEARMATDRLALPGEAKPDSCLKLLADEARRVINRLIFAKERLEELAAPAPGPVSKDDDGAFLICGAVAEAQPTGVVRAVVEALIDAPKPLTRAELNAEAARRCGKEVADARRVFEDYLKKHHEWGLVVCTHRGTSKADHTTYCFRRPDDARAPA